MFDVHIKPDWNLRALNAPALFVNIVSAKERSRVILLLNYSRDVLNAVLKKTLNEALDDEGKKKHLMSLLKAVGDGDWSLIVRDPNL